MKTWVNFKFLGASIGSIIGLMLAILLLEKEEEKNETAL